MYEFCEAKLHQDVALFPGRLEFLLILHIFLQWTYQLHELILHKLCTMLLRSKVIYTIHGTWSMLTVVRGRCSWLLSSLGGPAHDHGRNSSRDPGVGEEEGRGREKEQFH